MVVEDLMYIVKLGPGRIEVVQLEDPEDLKSRILESVHNIGHRVKDRILGILHNRFYRHRMNCDVNKFCQKCQRHKVAKPPHIKIQGCSGHLLASKPLEIVKMDFTLVERDSKGFEMFRLLPKFLLSIL